MPTVIFAFGDCHITKLSAPIYDHGDTAIIVPISNDVFTSSYQGMYVPSFLRVDTWFATLPALLGTVPGK